MNRSRQLVVNHLQQLKQWQREQQERLRKEQEGQLALIKEKQRRLQSLIEDHHVGKQNCCSTDSYYENEERLVDLSTIFEESDLSRSAVDVAVDANTEVIVSLSGPRSDDGDEQVLLHRTDLDSQPRRSHKSISSPSGLTSSDGNFKEDTPLKTKFNASKLSFDEHVEEELLKTQEIPVPAVQHQKMKRPFLRKGEGLARYGISNDMFPYATVKDKENLDERNAEYSNSKTYHTQGGYSKPGTSIRSLNLRPGRDFLALKTQLPAQPVLKEKLQSLNWIDSRLSLGKIVHSNDDDDECTSVASVDSVATNITDTSFGCKVKEVAKKQKQELVELKEFELLEEAANDSSFFSQSSEIKKVSKDYQQISALPSFVNESETLDGSLPGTSEQDDKHQNSRGDDEYVSGEMPIDSEFCDLVKSRRLSLQKKIDHRVNKEIIVSNREVEDRCDLDIPLPSKCNVEIDDDDAKSDGTIVASDSDVSHIYDFDDQTSWRDDDSISSSTNKVTSLYNSAKYSETNVDELPSPVSSDFISSIFTGLKATESKTPKSSGETEVDTVAESTTDCSAEVNLIQTRLQELETEIAAFKKENENLVRIKKEKAQELEQLKKDRLDFRKKQEVGLSDRKKEIENEKKKVEEERRKLRRERQTFDRLQKARKSAPTTNERLEFNKLKEQLKGLQDDLKDKEKRWSSTSSRYKSRIENLEFESKGLKKEVTDLQKQRLEILEQYQKKERQLSDALKGQKRLILSASKSQNSDSKEMSDALTENKNYDENISDGNELITSDIGSNNVVDSTEGSGVVSCTEGDDSAVQDESERHEKSNVVKSVRFESQLGRHGDYKEIKYNDRVDRFYNDGRQEIIFTNGTKKEIAADGSTVNIYYFNGDVYKSLPDSTTVYYFAETKTTQTTCADGTEVIHFSNNQVEKKYPGGIKHIIYPDKSSKTVFPDGSEESVAVDGSTVRVEADGSEIMIFPDGQKEVHTKEYKRREYPDGTLKTVYPDGRQETQYSNGRLRIKDRDGKVVVDHIP